MSLGAALRLGLRMLQEQGIEYALIGGIARNQWANPRETSDIGFAILVDHEARAKLRSTLLHMGITTVHDLEFQLSVETADGVQIDFLCAGSAFETEAVTNATLVDGIRLASREHLIVYKLIAGRAHDLGDIEAILTAAEEAKAAIDADLVEYWAREWGVLDRWREIRSATRRP